MREPEGYWRCLKCYGLNPMSMENCPTCDRPRPTEEEIEKQRAAKPVPTIPKAPGMGKS